MTEKLKTQRDELAEKHSSVYTDNDFRIRSHVGFECGFNAACGILLPLMRELPKFPDLDCGDNSCRFVDRSKPMGMRTNGGCRCRENRHPEILRYLLDSKEALSKIESVLGEVK